MYLKYLLPHSPTISKLRINLDLFPLWRLCDTLWLTKLIWHIDNLLGDRLWGQLHGDDSGHALSDAFGRVDNHMGLFLHYFRCNNLRIFGRGPFLDVHEFDRAVFRPGVVD